MAKGIFKDPELHRQNISKAMKGKKRKPFTKTCKENMSEARKKQWKLEGFKEKHHVVMKKIWQSEEYRNKLRDIVVERWKSEEFRSKRVKKYNKTLK
jgi:hypothetical protein